MTAGTRLEFCAGGAERGKRGEDGARRERSRQLDRKKVLEKGDLGRSNVIRTTPPNQWSARTAR